MKNFFISLFILTLFQTTIKSQEIVEPSPIKWYSLEQAQELRKKQNRPLLIDMYTDWCGWCKVMMKTTFSNKEVVNFINAYFYPVRFNAETKDTITYRDTSYVSKGKNHELAQKLMAGKMAFPTIVFVDKEWNATPIPGYTKAPEFIPLLIFFGEEVYKSSSYDKFEKYFNLTYLNKENELNKDSLTAGKVKWYSFEEAEKLNKKEPRLLYIDIFANMYISCNIMKETTYTHPVIADYLNKYYYPVRFNAASQDTVNAFGGTFLNHGKGPFSLHALAADLMGGKIQFPTLVHINKKGQLINRMTGYLSPEQLEPILIYFAKNKHTSVEWQKYLQSFESKIE